MFRALDEKDNVMDNYDKVSIENSIDRNYHVLTRLEIYMSIPTFFILDDVPMSLHDQQALETATSTAEEIRKKLDFCKVVYRYQHIKIL